MLFSVLWNIASSYVDCPRAFCLHVAQSQQSWLLVAISDNECAPVFPRRRILSKLNVNNAVPVYVLFEPHHGRSALNTCSVTFAFCPCLGPFRFLNFSCYIQLCCMYFRPEWSSPASDRLYVSFPCSCVCKCVRCPNDHNRTVGCDGKRPASAANLRSFRLFLHSFLSFRKSCFLEDYRYYQLIHCYLRFMINFTNLYFSLLVGFISGRLKFARFL